MIRFPTEAANADVLGQDTPLAEEPEGVSGRSAAQRARGRSDRPEHRRGRPAGQTSGAKANPDIDAPGLVKDPDSRKPS